MSTFNSHPAVRPCGPAQTFTYTGSAVQTTNPLPAGAGAIYVFATTAAYVALNNTATTQVATTSSIPLAPNAPVIIPIEPGFNDGALKVSAIQASANGQLFVLPVQAQ